MIATSDFLILLVCIGLGTYFMRAVFIFAMEAIPLTDTMKLVLRYIPPAVLAALCTPGIMLASGDISWLMGKERLVAGLCAAAVALWKRNMLLTIITGMAVLYLLQWINGSVLSF